MIESLSFELFNMNNLSINSSYENPKFEIR